MQVLMLLKYFSYKFTDDNIADIGKYKNNQSKTMNIYIYILMVTYTYEFMDTTSTDTTSAVTAIEITINNKNMKYQLLLDKNKINKKSSFTINELMNELQMDPNYLKNNTYYNDCINTYLLYVMISNNRRAIYYFDHIV